jgi:hypothetical protein
VARLHIHLREGFKGEPVTVAVGSDTLLDKPNVKTRM